MKIFINRYSHNVIGKKIFTAYSACVRLNDNQPDKTFQITGYKADDSKNYYGFIQTLNKVLSWVKQNNYSKKFILLITAGHYINDSNKAQYKSAITDFDNIHPIVESTSQSLTLHNMNRFAVQQIRNLSKKEHKKAQQAHARLVAKKQHEQKLAEQKKRIAERKKQVTKQRHIDILKLVQKIIHSEQSIRVQFKKHSTAVSDLNALLHHQPISKHSQQAIDKIKLNSSIASSANNQQSAQIANNIKQIKRLSNLVTKLNSDKNHLIQQLTRAQNIINQQKQQLARKNSMVSSTSTSSNNPVISQPKNSSASVSNSVAKPTNTSIQTTKSLQQQLAVQQCLNSVIKSLIVLPRHGTVTAMGIQNMLPKEDASLTNKIVDTLTADKYIVDNNGSGQYKVRIGFYRKFF